MLMQLDKEDDVNKVLRYFSYEHFYVIYCKARPCLSAQSLPAAIFCTLLQLASCVIERAANVTPWM